MASSSKSTIRSISLPSRSHPTTERIEEELNKFKTLRGSSSCPPTSNTIAHGVSSLVDLYESLDDLLNSPLTQKAINYRQHEQCVDDLQAGFMSLLDVCGTARDVVSLLKGNCRDIQSCLRRRKGVLEIETKISSYIFLRKKMIKESKKMIKVSKKMDSAVFLELDDRLVSAVIRALREVVFESFSILQTLFLFFYVPMLKPKQMKRSLVSKLLQLENCGNVNELQHLDIALQVLCRSEASEGDTVQAAQNSLRSFEGNIESIENGLESLFRGLIKARTSLLNIVSA